MNLSLIFLWISAVGTVQNMSEGKEAKKNGTQDLIKSSFKKVMGGKLNLKGAKGIAPTIDKTK